MLEARNNPSSCLACDGSGLRLNSKAKSTKKSKSNKKTKTRKNPADACSSCGGLGYFIHNPAESKPKAKAKGLSTGAIVGLASAAGLATVAGILLLSSKKEKPAQSQAEAKETPPASSSSAPSAPSPSAPSPSAPSPSAPSPSPSESSTPASPAPATDTSSGEVKATTDQAAYESVTSIPVPGTDVVLFNYTGKNPIPSIDDGLSAINRLAFAGVLVQPTPAIGLCSDFDSLKASVDKAFLGALILESASATKTAEDNRKDILFALGETGATDVNSIISRIFTADVQDTLAFTIDSIVRKANTYWEQRRVDAITQNLKKKYQFRNSSGNFKKGSPEYKEVEKNRTLLHGNVSKIEAQRIMSNSLWAIIQDALIRRTGSESKSDKIIMACKDALTRLGLPSYTGAETRSSTAVVIVRAFLKGIFNCEIQSKNGIFVDYEKTNASGKRIPTPTPIDFSIEGTKGPTNKRNSSIVGGVVFYKA